MNKVIITILFLFFFVSSLFKLNADDDTYINSSNVTYDEAKNIIELAENSKINFKKTNILIDKGIIDYNQNKFEVFGNFYLYEDLNILSGKNLIGDTKLNRFKAVEVSYIYNNNLKIDSESLERVDNTVYFYDSFLTPCELDGFFNCPTWSLRIDKTNYNIEEDKFTHFDSFLQIADYKLFYLPYFSHYGSKAPRKKGFLPPTLEFSIGSNQAINIPYYLPISDQTEVTFKTKLLFDQNIEFLENYNLNTVVLSKRSGGDMEIQINNQKEGDNENINSTFRINTTQTINEKSKFSASGVFTNSISTTRSNNENPIKFEDIYLRVENYDLIASKDYLKTEISSIRSFDTTNVNEIPFSPNIKYHNYLKLKSINLLNELNFTILKRDSSTALNPSESFILNLNNNIFKNFYFKNLSNFNSIKFTNAFNNYSFENNDNLNHTSQKSLIFLSSEAFYNLNKISTSRLKINLPIQLQNSKKLINEDSNSITFGYQNQFAENRFFGNDLVDNTPRITYGFENTLKLNENNLDINLNQSYSFNKKNNYSNLINQYENISDYSLEVKLHQDNYFFKIDSRLNRKNLDKKEINYNFSLTEPFGFSLNYNETDKNAFSNLSNDTQALSFSFKKDINENVLLQYVTSLDVKNNYDPYKSEISLSIFDECSRLDINYTNKRFNDNFNTTPEETISLRFLMDYIGFFGYSQSTDLFFKEAGNFNYGL